MQAYNEAPTVGGMPQGEGCKYRFCYRYRNGMQRAMFRVMLRNAAVKFGLALLILITVLLGPMGFCAGCAKIMNPQAHPCCPKTVDSFALLSDAVVTEIAAGVSGDEEQSIVVVLPASELPQLGHAAQTGALAEARDCVPEYDRSISFHQLLI